jgi:peptidoglycan hydrolase-like amidase
MILALATIHVSVFSLFHPAAFTVRAARGTAIIVQTGESSQVLEGARFATLNGPARIAGRNGAQTNFVLSIPGRIVREFHGTLEVRKEGDHLLALVAMDVETAVASIVEGEAPGASPEARYAQAVAARSYLVGTHGRHVGYDFCDTTHCQYLLGASASGSVGQLAALNTRSLAISYQGHVVPALYSADCGGHTRSLKEAGWDETEYPFFGVACPIKGSPQGHGIGMCQRGAMELARQGKSFREILNYYFPATTLVTLDRP